MTMKLKSGGVTPGPPWVVEKGLPALIAFASSVGAIPAKNAAPNSAPCRPASIFRDNRNETKKKTKYQEARNRFGNLKLTATPIKRPTITVKTRRCCRCPARTRQAVRKPASAHKTMARAIEWLAL